MPVSEVVVARLKRRRWSYAEKTRDDHSHSGNSTVLVFTYFQTQSVVTARVYGHVQRRVRVHGDRHSFGIDEISSEHVTPPVSSRVPGNERRHLHSAQLDRPRHAQRSPATVPAANAVESNQLSK